MVLPLILAACAGGETAPPETPPVAPAASEPAPTGSASDKPNADGEEGAWAGEAEAKSEKVPPGAEGKTETRTMEVIAKIVKDNRQPVRDCMDKVKKDLPDLKGDMVIHFVIDPEGKVKKAELNQERSTLKSPPLVDCAVQVVLGIKFPPSSRGMDTTVNYPYNLN